MVGERLSDMQDPWSKEELSLKEQEDPWGEEELSLSDMKKKQKDPSALRKPYAVYT